MKYSLKESTQANNHNQTRDSPIFNRDLLMLHRRVANATQSDR
jgi:hypothetical protein